MPVYPGDVIMCRWPCAEPHDVQFSCAMTQLLLAHHWVHQCLLSSRFTAHLIPWGVSALVARWGSSFLSTITFLIIHRFLSLKVLLKYICFSRTTVYNTFQIEKLFWIWWKVLDTIILWQDASPRCEQTHAAFEVVLSLDQGQGVYSGRSDVVGSSQVRVCHTCIIDVMGFQFVCRAFSPAWCHFQHSSVVPGAPMRRKMTHVYVKIVSPK